MHIIFLRWMVLLLFVVFSGCSSNAGISDQQKTSSNESRKELLTAQRAPMSNDSSMSYEELRKYVEEKYPYPSCVNRYLDYFARKGIVWFYELNKRVPANMNEYLESGIPMIIPNDYFSNQVYHIVDNLDMNDTSGFTFSSDGIETCSFEFALKNTKTNENFIRTISFDEGNWKDYKTIEGVPQILANLKATYDTTKMESLYQFLMDYALIYSHKHDGNTPSDLNEMLEGEGQLIEKAWNWKPTTCSLEFGEDVIKNRVYMIRGCNKSDDEKGIYIEQVYPEEQYNMEPVEGVTFWEYSSENEVTSNVLTKTKFIDTNGLYDFFINFK